MWTAILTFLMLMAGMPTFAAYFFYLGFAYALFYACRLYWGRWRRLAVTLVAGIGAVAIGAIMSLPYTGELLGSVGSNGYSDSRSNWSFIGLAPEQLKTMFFPFMTTHNTVNNIESMLYTGILAIITVAFTIVRFRSKPRVGFFACSAAIVGILLFTPYLDIVFTNMPMVNTSYKFRIVILLNFALAALLGINMDDLLSRVIDTMRERLAVWAVTAVALAVYVYAAFRTRGTSLVSENNVEFGPLQRRIAYLTVAVFAVVVLCRTCLPALFRRSAAFAVASKAMSVLCTVALCAAVVVDTGYFAMQYLPLTQKGSSAIPQVTSTIKYLQENTKNGEKIVGKNVDLPTDSAMFYGLRDIRGHALSMTSPDIKAYYTAIDKSAYESSPTNTVFKNVSNENLLRYLGVKFIVSSETQENDPEYSSGEGMKSVGDDGLLVKELDNPAPEVQLVDNIQVFDTNDEVLDTMGKRYQENTVFFSREYGAPEGAKTTMDAPTENVDTTADVKSVDQQDDGDLTIVVSSESMQYLLVNEYDDGDWTASVDSQETPIYKGNGLIRAVAVPAGNHTVKFTYEPKRLWWYLAATAAGAVVLVAIAVLYKREDEFFAGL
ncbi:YfhO family protein [Bifidobacterium callitrichos]|uniref:YfhO family protein n=1 Tax=Bifidobacterium callitrichos TaxID=762209 RepID=UPI00168B8C08|nr:YfhO family protein [Bifidobacterium callitrichos]